MHRRLLLLGGVLLAALAVSAAVEPRVKFIALGWDIPSTSFLAANYEQMEREGPFDGVIFRFAGQSPDGQPISSETIWNTMPWQRTWLEPVLADLKACRFERFRHNFVRFMATPDRVAWDDDAGWAVLTDKAGHCAWLSREGGAVGLAPDFEVYGENQWKWDAAAGRSFADTVALARRRGEQLIRAVAAEQPDAVILTLFSLSTLSELGKDIDLEPGLRIHPYGLLPAFWDGMIAGAAPGMVLVDGCEDGYIFEDADEVRAAALDMTRWSGLSMRLISPDNRLKAKQQTQAGFGCYLDMYTNPPGHHYYREGIDGSRLKRFEQYLTTLRDTADEYVWIYGEQHRWWSGQPNGGNPLWEEALPGVTAMIDRLRDPVDWAQRQLAAKRAAGTAVNLLANGDFAQAPAADAAGVPGWEQWQSETVGVFDHDATVGGGAGRAERVAWGCFMQGIDVVPGETYYVRGRARWDGAGEIKMSVRWRNAAGAWAQEGEDRSLAFGAPAADGWAIADGVVVVPAEVAELLAMLGVRDQAADADRAWFDDVEVVRLAP